MILLVISFPEKSSDLFHWEKFAPCQADFVTSFPPLRADQWSTGLSAHSTNFPPLI